MTDSTPDNAAEPTKVIPPSPAPAQPSPKFASGKATPPPTPAPEPTGQFVTEAPRRGGGFALFLAVVAVLLAVVASGIAVYAVKKAADATDKLDKTLAAAGIAPAPSSAAQSPAPASSPSGGDQGTQPSPAPSASLGDPLDPKAVYVEHFTNKELMPSVPDGTYANIDLDTPKIQHEDEGAELTIRSNYNSSTPSLSFADGVQVAYAPSATATSADCLDALRTALLNVNTRVAASRDTKLCILSSKKQADLDGVPVRLTLLYVEALDTDKATVRLTSWEQH
ncbi:MAG: hypothetical protein HOV66_24350 [Streptomycetaceae bacterium]|nr:hypothetical protein [Streptomycetaceae bacterium]